jgi:hypothetical protein
MLSRRLFVLVCAFLSLAYAAPIDKQEDPFKRVDGLAPLLGSHHEDKIEDYYIVLFHPDHTHDDHYAHVGQNLSDAVHLKSGYGAHIPDLSLLTQIRSDAGVLAVEVDREITIPDFVRTPTNETVPEHVDHEPGLAKRGTKTFETRKNYLAPWGLQMISAGKKLSSPPQDMGTYEYLANAGEGVSVYILVPQFIVWFFVNVSQDQDHSFAIPGSCRPLRGS